MRNILLIISYDGTNFSGWQKQKKTRTVQGEIEKALEKIHKMPTAIQGSGRTDAGVHATGQAATFLSPVDSMPAEKYQVALNSMLPKDIRIMDAKEVPESLHARFSATKRTYRYFIHCGETAFAHQSLYVWSIRHHPDINKLNRMASCLKGEIDCTTFSAAGDMSLSKFRYLYNAVFFTQGDLLVFEISANAFLYRMVRSIVGSLIHFEKNNDEDYFEKVLKSKDRKLAGPTAPNTGLFLWNVSFDGKRHDGSSEKENETDE